jgi:hypothetical protein
VLFRDMVPPRAVLTVVGLRIWWFRLGAFLLGMLFIILAASLEKKEPSASANAREPAVIRMGLLRLTFPVAQKGLLSARPRAAHL